MTADNKFESLDELRDFIKANPEATFSREGSNENTLFRIAFAYEGGRELTSRYVSSGRIAKAIVNSATSAYNDRDNFSLYRVSDESLSLLDPDMVLKKAFAQAIVSGLTGASVSFEEFKTNELARIAEQERILQEKKDAIAAKYADKANEVFNLSAQLDVAALEAEIRSSGPSESEKKLRKALNDQTFGCRKSVVKELVEEIIRFTTGQEFDASRYTFSKKLPENTVLVVIKSGKQTTQGTITATETQTQSMNVRHPTIEEVTAYLSRKEQKEIEALG